MLAPYFSVLLQPDSGEAEYYILGQRPLGGTTIRKLTADGTNYDMGDGPQPELEAFLDALRARNTRKPQAAVTRPR